MTDTDLQARRAEIREAALAATPGDLDTVNDPPDEYGGKEDDGRYDCPTCDGEGTVDGVTYCNFDNVAMGVQFFGIGNEFGAYERYFRAARPATVLAVLDRLDAAEARVAELEAERQWRPIETAPTDGCRVLLLVPPYGASTGHYWPSPYADSELSEWRVHSVLNRSANPTHWMPLPPPVANQEARTKLAGNSKMSDKDKADLELEVGKLYEDTNGSIWEAAAARDDMFFCCSIKGYRAEIYRPDGVSYNYTVTLVREHVT